MKKVVLNAIAAALVVLGLGSVATVSPAYAQFLCPDGKTEVDDYSQCTQFDASKIKDRDAMTTLNVVINVVIGLVGFIAVVMIIIGGISFATSQGDTAKTTKAKNTILYGIVGLVVALLAFAIVNFVLQNVFGS